VTAISPSNRSARQSFARPDFSNPIVAVNIILACLVLGGFAYYVAGANAVASTEYHISAERAQIAKLTQDQSSLTAEKSATEDPASAAAFAQAQHMVEAKDIVYVFENDNVALQK
jgi:cell division protein FtsB